MPSAFVDQNTGDVAIDHDRSLGRQELKLPARPGECILDLRIGECVELSHDVLIVRHLDRWQHELPRRLKSSARWRMIIASPPMQASTSALQHGP